MVLPVPWGMAHLMAHSMSQALESGVEELGEAAFEQVEEWAEEAGIESGDDEYYDNPPDFVCDNGETIPRHWFNDGYPDCSDGSDEITSNEGPTLHYDWQEDQPTEFPVPTEGSSLHHVLSTGELTYCTDPFYPPFEEYDANGDMVGFDIDVADHLASALSEEYGTPVQFVPLESEWDPIIPNLNSGEMCDAIISAMTKTEERDYVVDFTRGYYTWSQGVIGGSGSAPISDVSELNQDGVTIGVQSGTTSDLYAADNLPMATTSAYEDYPSLISALNNGDVMYALGDTSVLSSDGTIMVTFYEELFGIALREGNNELLTALDFGITNLVESEEYGSIFSTWIEGEPHMINDWSPDWDFGSQEYYGDESGDSSEDGFTCLYETWQVIPSSGVNDGYPDCYDGSDEEMAPEVWSCAVDVRLDSIEHDFGSGIGANHPLNSWQAFDEKIDDHPGFPEWCGTEVGVLEIGETQPNLPPADDIYGSWYGDDNYDPYDVGIRARNATHFHELWGGGEGNQHQDCENYGGSWSAEYNSCAFQASPDYAIDGELIWGEYGWTRYHWSGDYLYLAIPATVDTPPDIVWNGVGPRVTDFICDQDDRWERVQEWQVGDGIEDCYNGEDENPDASSNEPGDPAGSTDLEMMFEALEESNLQKTMEAFSERLEVLMQDNVPEEPKYDIEDLCATMLWDPSDVRVLGVALVLEGGLLFGPQIKDSIPHPTTTINVEFLSGQAARDAKSGIATQSSMDEMAPDSKHDLAELYEILGPGYLPNLDTTDSDGDGTLDFFDTDDDNDGVPDWEDPEPTTVESEAESSSLPAHGLVASLSVIAAAAMLIPRRDD
jgi:ABC-type amino acid transport substrate-binding protein